MCKSFRHTLQTMLPTLRTHTRSATSFVTTTTTSTAVAASTCTVTASLSTGVCVAGSDKEDVASSAWWDLSSSATAPTAFAPGPATVAPCWGHTLTYIPGHGATVSGLNSYGQIGAPECVAGRFELSFADGVGVVAGSAGRVHTVLLVEDGSGDRYLVGLGSNSAGQLATEGYVGAANSEGSRELIGSLFSAETAQELGSCVSVTRAPSLAAVDVVCGFDHTLITDGETVWSTGLGCDGQLGRGRRLTNCSTPTAVSLDDSVERVVRIFAGGDFSLALTTSERDADGYTLYGWGNNEYNQLCSDASREPVDDPVTVAKLDSSLKLMAVGAHHTLVCTDDGKLLTWGWGGRDNDDSVGREPVEIAVPFASDSSLISIAAGSGTNYAVTDKGELWSWGYDIDGSLARPTASREDAWTVTKVDTGGVLVDSVVAGLNSVFVRVVGFSDKQ